MSNLKINQENIKKYNKSVNALITVIDNPKSVCDGPLSGLTFVLKDSYLTNGIKTTAAANRSVTAISPHRFPIPVTPYYA